MEEVYPDSSPLYVYLTLKGDKPSDHPKWMPYKHADVHRVLKHVRDQNQSTIGEDVLVFLDNYLELISELPSVAR